MTDLQPSAAFVFMESVLYLLLILRGIRQQEGPRPGARLLYAMLGASFVLAVMHGAYLTGAFSETELVHLRYAAQLRALLLAVGIFFVAHAYLRPGGQVRPWVFAAAAWVLVPLAAGFFIPLTWLLLLGFVFWWGGVFALTIAGAQRWDEPLYRNDLFYWDAALAVLASGGVLLLLELPVPASPLLVLGFSLASYTVFRPRLPDAHLVLRAAFQFLLLSLASVVVYTAAFLVFEALFLVWPGYSSLYRGFLLAVLLAVVINPALWLLENQFSRSFSTGAVDTPRTLREYSHNITDILDLKLLAKAIAEALSHALDARRVFLFTVHHEPMVAGAGSYQLEGVQGTVGADPESLTVEGSSPFASYFAGPRGPLLRQRIASDPRFQEVSAETLQWMDDLNLEVFASIYRKGEWIGLLALGPRASGAAYDSSALELVQTLADQTAVAMENARLVNGLMRLNDDYRRSYVAMEASNRKLERLEKTKSDFIHIASRELRTPLSRITGSSRMLLQDSALQENPFYSDLLSKIVSGGERLQEVLDSMLDMTRIDARVLELNVEPVALYPLLDAVLHDLRNVSAVRKLKIQVDEGVRDAKTVQADEASLYNVFYHLVRNAIQYTPDGGHISISACALRNEETNMPGGAMEVVVQDTGIGVDPRFQEFIFGKFSLPDELDASSGRTEGGPGLGLAIVKGIVEAHGGSIRVESPGRDKILCPGSKFIVHLPLRQSTSGSSPSLDKNLE